MTETLASPNPATRTADTPIVEAPRGESPAVAMVRVVLPAHLRTLAQVEREVALPIAGPVTQAAVLDALEAAYPMLGGTIRGRTTKLRRPLVRFFACGEDLSHTAPDDPLPERVATGAEPFVVIGAMAGG